MARRRRRKLNVKLALLLTASGLAVVALGVGFFWYRNLRYNQYPREFERARQYAQQGNHNKAIECFNRAIAFSSHKQDWQAGFQYRLAQAEFLDQWYRSDKSLTQDKRGAILRQRLSRLSEAVNMKPDDLDARRRYVEACWSTVEVFGMYGYEEVIKASGPYLDPNAGRPNDAEVHRWRAKSYLALSPAKREYVPLALEALEQAAQLDPTDAETYVDWAWLLEQEKEPARALEVVRQGVRHNEKSARLYASLARLVLVHEHDPESAARHIAHAQTLPDKSVDDCVAIGQYHLLRVSDPRGTDVTRLLKDGDHAQATEAFAQAVAAGPDTADVYAQLAHLHRSASPPQMARSEEVLRAGWKAFEDRRGDQPVGTMDVRERQRYLRAIITLRSALAGAILLRKSEYADQWPQRLAEAKEHVAFLTEQAESTHMVPPYVPLKLQGQVALAQGENDQQQLVKAEKLLRQAHDLMLADKRVDPETVFHLIGIYQSLSQYGEARKLMDALLARFPDDPAMLLAAARMDAAFGELTLAAEELRTVRQLAGRMTAEQQLEAGRLEAIVSRGLGQSGGPLIVPDRITEAMIPALVNEARLLHARRQSQEALGICQAILAQYPGNPDARLLRVAMQLEEGKMDAARADLEEGLKHNPDAPGLKLQRALLDTTSAEQREQLHLEYIEQAFQGAARELELARFHERQGRPDEALAHLRKAVDLEPGDSTTVRMLFANYVIKKDYDNAEAVIETARQAGLDDVELMQATLIHERHQDPDTIAEGAQQAITLLESALARREAFSEVHALLGQLYLDREQRQDRHKDDLDKARHHLNRSFELNPTSPAALIYLTRLAERDNRADEHEKWINLAYRQAPNHPYVRNHWLAYREKRAATPEQVEDLIQYSQAVARREPGDLDNQLRLARLLMKTDPPRSDEAGAIYSRLYADAKGQDQSLTLLGLYLDFLRQSGQAEQAQALLEGQARQEKDQVGYFILYGNHMAALGTRRSAEGQSEEAAKLYSAAMQCFDSAIRRDPQDARAYQAKATFQSARSDWSGAAATFQQAVNQQDAVKQRPDDLVLRELRIRLIGTLFANERFEEARQVALDMAAANPQDLGALVLQGRALHLGGHHEQARALYDRVLKANPGSTEALRYRSLTSVAQGVFPAAVADLRQLYGLTKNISILVEIAKIQTATRNLDGAKETLERARIDHPDSPLLQSELARVLTLRADYDAALRVLEAGKQTDPNQPRWWTQEAEIHKRRNDPGKRVVALKKALELNPRDIGMLSEYVDALFEAGEFRELMEMGRTIQNPPPAVAVVLLVSMGRAHLAGGNEAEGLRCIRQAYEACQGPEVGAVDMRVRKALGESRLAELLRQWLSERDNWPMRLSLARLLRESKDTQAQAAELLTACDLSNASDLAKTIVAQDHGYILQELGRYDQAKKVYDAALTLTGARIPSLQAALLNNLAYMLAENLGDPQEGVKRARQAMALAPQDPAVADTVGWAHFRAGQLDLAEHHITRAIELEATAPYRYHLGMVLEARGRKEQAIQQYRLGLDIIRDKPDDDYHGKIKARLEALGAR